MGNNEPYKKELPDKLYFRVGEVGTIVGVPAYVLRFWETEFKRINPKRTPSGQRLYRKKDVELILKIRHLLYEPNANRLAARTAASDLSPLLYASRSLWSLDVASAAP